MLIYVSDARNSATLVNEARRMGCRHMVEPKRYRPQRIPYALDNGAFGAFTRGQPLDEDRFYAVLDRAASASRSISAACPWCSCSRSAMSS